MGNCVLILQSCTNSRKLLVGLCSEKSENYLVIGMEFEEEMLVDTKEEDFLGYVNSPTIKAEQDQVSYICICPLLNTFYEYPILCSIIYWVDLCLSRPVNK